jgi:ABC-type polysaccharide/polyol phosphate transport system ATPase subunit
MARPTGNDGAPVVALDGVGIHFRVARRSRHGRTPRMIGARRQPFWGIRNISFEVGHGEVVGLLGPNSAGKTTLLRTIAGIYAPDEGRLFVGGAVAPMLSVIGGLMPRLSGWQNIQLLMALLDLPRDRRDELSPEIGEFSGLGEFLDAQVRTYSSGMKARLMFSVAAFAESDILAVDEVLAVGDAEFREKSEGIIRSFVESNKTVLIASHEVEKLVELCDHMVRLEHGRVVEVGQPRAVADHYVGDLRSAGIEPSSHSRRGGRTG